MRFSAVFNVSSIRPKATVSAPSDGLGFSRYVSTNVCEGLYDPFGYLTGATETCVLVCSGETEPTLVVPVDSVMGVTNCPPVIGFRRSRRLCPNDDVPDGVPDVLDGAFVLEVAGNGWLEGTCE